MNVRKLLQIAYLIVGVLVVAEFLFVQGLFTWLLALVAVVAVGAANVVYAVREREWMDAAMYILCSVALSMGYLAAA